MNKIKYIVSCLVGFILAVAATVAAAPYPLQEVGGGTATNATSSPGQILIGTNSQTYTPAYLLCNGGCTISTSSGQIIINTPSGSSTLQLLSSIAPIVYNSSTGQFSWTNSNNYISSSTGNGLYLQIANNLSDLNSTSSARTNLGYSGLTPISISATGTIIFTNPGYVTSSTGLTYFFPATSTVFYPNSNPSGFLTAASSGLLYYPLSSNPAGYLTTAVATNTGNWAGTWNTYAPAYFQTALGFTPYNSTNPSNFIPLTALSAAGTGLTYNNGTGVFTMSGTAFAPSSTVSSQWTTTSTGIFYNNGNVGIGTATPGSLLSVGTNPNVDGSLFQVSKNQNASTYATFVNTTSGSAASAGEFVSLSPTLTSSVGTIAYSAGFTTSGIQAANTGVIFSSMPSGLNIGTKSTAQTSLWTNNLERVRIDTSGNVGIETTTPNSSLQVNGNFALTSSSTIVTGSLGGSALLAGACSSVTSSIDSTVTSSTAAFETTPQKYPGAGAYWSSYLSAPSVLTTQVCEPIAATPTATTYVVKIIK